MKKHLLASSLLILTSYFAFAVTLDWPVETTRVAPVTFDAYHGETLVLKPCFYERLKPLAITNYAASIYWQTNGMDAAYWQTNTCAVASNTVTATFLGAFDPGASAVRGFIALAATNSTANTQSPTPNTPSPIYRAAFTIRYRASPGFSPGILSPPIATLDFASVTVTNAPYYTKAESDARYSGGGSGGCDTNAVRALIAPATNAVLETAETLYARKASSQMGGTIGATVLYGSGTTVSKWGVDYADKANSAISATTATGAFAIKNYSSATPYWRTLSFADQDDWNANGGGIYLYQSGVAVKTNAWTSDVVSPVAITNIAIAVGDDRYATSASVSSAVATRYPLTSGNALAATVSNWENYWTGDKVRLSVTNYYGSTSGELPRLRIEEFDHSTTNGTVISNFYHVVWDEESRHTNYQATVDAKVGAISNTVMTAAWMQTANQLAAKAPRAWGSVTSAGTQAPANTVWMTEPNTVFAGGTEYAHVSCGEGTIAVLACKGAAVYTEGEEGVFKFQTDDGSYYFGFNIGTAYYIGCRTDGISTTQSGDDTLVTLTYDLTSSTNPIIYHTTNLTANATWETATVTWEQNPPAGTMVCYINAGSSPCGYYKAAIEHSGHTEFRTNMQANLMGGIVATNQSTNTMQPIEPYITTNNQGTAVISWRIKQ